MLQLVQPIWLMAMAAIAWPVLLHFWNDRQGRVLRIGSVALLERSSPRRSWSRRLSEWLLLLLRCLLLAVLALLLAGPSWQKKAIPSGIKGWILVAANLREVPRLYGALIDSLSKIGFERHDFATIDVSTDPAANPANLRSDWDAFRSADREAPAGIPFIIISPALAGRFHGSKPISDRPVKWYTYIPQDSTRHWIASAWLSSRDSVRITEGISDPRGTGFQYYALAAIPGTVGDFRIGLTEGRLSVAIDSQPPMIVDTAALRIAVYTDPGFEPDSRYVLAAIRAWAQMTRRRVHIDVSTTTSVVPGVDRPAAPDWLVWLASKPAPKTGAAKVLQYETGNSVSVDTWMQGVEYLDIVKETERPISAGSIPVDRLLSIWQDGYGRTLLGLENTAQGSVYHFYSRFDPAWNGLVWSPRFPGLLGELLFGSAASPDATRGTASSRTDAPPFDRRVLDPQQVLPLKGDTTNTNNSKMGTVIDLTPIFGILLLLLFIGERAVSLRASQLSNYDRPVGTT